MPSVRDNRDGRSVVHTVSTFAGLCLDWGMSTSVRTRDTAPASRYPAEHETEVVFRDGSTVHVRRARPSDEAAMKVFLAGRSLPSRWSR